MPLDVFPADDVKFGDLVGMRRPLHPGAVEVSVLFSVEVIVDPWQLQTFEQTVRLTVDGSVLLHHRLGRRVRQRHQVTPSGRRVRQRHQVTPSRRLLVDVERQDEPLDDRRGEAVVGLDEVAGLLSHVLDVEHVVQVAVLVADQVEHHVAVVLVSVDMVKDHHGVAIETRGDCLPGLSVDDVEQSRSFCR